jgi:hypothetical protein
MPNIYDPQFVRWGTTRQTPTPWRPTARTAKSGAAGTRVAGSEKTGPAMTAPAQRQRAGSVSSGRHRERAGQSRALESCAKACTACTKRLNFPPGLDRRVCDRQVSGCRNRILRACRGRGYRNRLRLLLGRAVAYRRVAGGKTCRSAEPLRNFSSRLPAIS